MKLIKLLLIFSTLLFSTTETNPNICHEAYSINELDGAGDSTNYSDTYFSRWNSNKDIYLNFITLEDGNLDLNILKSASSSMKYQLFIGKSCNSLDMVALAPFSFERNTTIKIDKNQKYIVKLVKEKNGYSRYRLDFDFKSLKPIEKTNGLIAKYYTNENFRGIPEISKVEKRYPTSDGIVKTYYARILALFKPNKSREIIEKDMDAEIEGNRKIKLISAFAKTGINDDYVVNKLENMLYNTIPNSTYHDVEKEIISISITINLAKSNRDDRFDKLINIASTSSFSEGTRANALIDLYAQLQSNTTVDKNHIKSRLEQLSQDINSSQILEQNEKDFLNTNIMQIMNNLQGV